MIGQQQNNDPVKEILRTAGKHSMGLRCLFYNCLLQLIKKEKRVRKTPVMAFRNFVSVALCLVFTFVRLSCQSLTYALCLEKLSLRPCALLLTAPLYPALLPLHQLLRFFPLSLCLSMPNLCCLMT